MQVRHPGNGDHLRALDEIIKIKNMKKSQELVKWIIIAFFSSLIILALIHLGKKFTNNSDMSSYGQFGDYLGGVIGTIISLVTLLVVYFQLTQVNNQTMQNSIALLLQSYQHTIDDFEWKEVINVTRNVSGREAISNLLIDFWNKSDETLLTKISKGDSLMYNDLTNKQFEFLRNEFPTHIPAIIVSMLYTISHTSKKTKDISIKQIKSMLSYEERKLLVLFGIEQIIDNDITGEDDWKLIKELLGLNDKKTLPPWTETDNLKWKLLIDTINTHYGKQNN